MPVQPRRRYVLLYSVVLLSLLALFAAPHAGAAKLTLEPVPGAAPADLPAALEAAKAVIADRLGRAGTAGGDVTIVDGNKLHLTFDREEEKDHLRRLCARPYKLTFHTVSNTAETKEIFRKIEEKFPGRFLPLLKTEEGSLLVPAENYDQVRQTIEEASKTEGLIPQDGVVLFGPSGQAGRDIYVINKEPGMVAEDLSKSSARPDTQNPPYWMIQFSFKPEAAEAFYKLTQENLHKPLAMVLDGEVLSAPVIQQAIRDSGQITGDFTQEQAQEIVIGLSTKPLPLALQEVAP